MNVAFKEWAVIVDALETGRQSLIFRKGGIHEGRGGFKMDHNEFLLFPTLFHQQADGVLDSARQRFTEIQPTLGDGSEVKFTSFARVHACHYLETSGMAERFREEHLWRDEVIAERFDWSQKKGVHLVVLRVFRLPTPILLPMRENYGGCKSWVNLTHEIDVSAAKPVLTDSQFAETALRLENLLA